MLRTVPFASPLSTSVKGQTSHPLARAPPRPLLEEGDRARGSCTGSVIPCDTLGSCGPLVQIFDVQEMDNIDAMRILREVKILRHLNGHPYVRLPHSAAESQYAPDMLGRFVCTRRSCR